MRSIRPHTAAARGVRSETTAMLHSMKTLHGFDLQATDGAIGQVKDFYFDDSEWLIRFLVVQTGDRLGHRQVLIGTQSIRDIDWGNRCVQTSITQHQVRKSPDIDAMAPVSRQHALQQYEYHGYPCELGGPGVWGFGPMPTMLASGHGRQSPANELRQEQAFVKRQA